MLETDPNLVSAFSGVIELGVFMLTYSVPIFLGVIVTIFLMSDLQKSMRGDDE